MSGLSFLFLFLFSRAKSIVPMVLYFRQSSWLDNRSLSSNLDTIGNSEWREEEEEVKSVFTQWRTAWPLEQVVLDLVS